MREDLTVGADGEPYSEEVIALPVFDPQARDEELVKELATKLSWAVASTLHVGYGRKSYLRTKCLSWATQLYERKLEWMDKARK